MKKVAFYTLGCKVNQYETDAMAGLFEQKGYEIVDFNEKADVYVINTCGVTGEAAKKSRKSIRKAIRKNPNAVVAVAGCYAQTELEEIKRIPGVDVVIGTARKGDIVNLVEKAGESKKPIDVVKDILKVNEYEKISPFKRKEKTRAFLKIQEGCNQFCAYCIIPYARGPIRSRDPEDVVGEAAKLVEQGYKEIVLTGINLVMYGRDLPDVDLKHIVKLIHNIQGLERIRLSSIEPVGITEDLIEGITSLPKVCPHFHIPLQSGSDVVLKKMNRRYTTQHYRHIISSLRQRIPDVSITTDIIVGFPGETEREFEKTCFFAEEMGFSKIHVFKYSKRKGTPAASMKAQVPEHEKRRRSSKLLMLSRRMEREYIDKFIGSIKDIIIEKEARGKRGLTEGITDNYIRVWVAHNNPAQGEVLKVKLIKREEDHAVGEVV